MRIRPRSLAAMCHRLAYRGLAATTVAVTVLAVSGCHRPPSTTPLSALPSLSAPATSAPPVQSRTQAQAEALAAYRGMWAAYAKAGLTANPDEPDLAAVAADNALTVLRTGLTETRDKGQVFKGSYESHPKVVTVSPTDHPVSVLIADCLDTTDFRTYTTSGQLTDNKRGGRRATGATVRRLDGVWKVISFGVREKGTC